VATQKEGDTDTAMLDGSGDAVHGAVRTMKEAVEIAVELGDIRQDAVRSR